MMAVLEKRAGLQLGNCDAYVNLAGGMKLGEPAIDLGIVLSIVSSYKNRADVYKRQGFGTVNHRREGNPAGASAENGRKGISDESG